MKLFLTIKYGGGLYPVCTLMIFNEKAQTPDLILLISISTRVRLRRYLTRAAMAAAALTRARAAQADQSWARRRGAAMWRERSRRGGGHHRRQLVQGEGGRRLELVIMGKRIAINDQRKRHRTWRGPREQERGGRWLVPQEPQERNTRSARFVKSSIRYFSR